MADVEGRTGRRPFNVRSRSKISEPIVYFHVSLCQSIL